VRIAALSKLHCIYVFTHDSIFCWRRWPYSPACGTLAAARAIPNLKVIRPCDAIETVEAWLCAIEHQGPTILALSRQNLPVIERNSSHEINLNKGAYMIYNCEDPDIIILPLDLKFLFPLKLLNCFKPGYQGKSCILPMLGAF
jgi:transketolase